MLVIERTEGRCGAYYVPFDKVLRVAFGALGRHV